MLAKVFAKSVDQSSMSLGGDCTNPADETTGRQHGEIA
jgi:hypothetical protein